MRSALAALLLLAVVLAVGCPGEPEPIPFTLLQANVGNTLLACDENAGYIFKLCEVSVENAIRDNIAALQPDVIAFQEILPSCDGIDEDDERFVCHPDHVAANGASQIDRLLGDAYDTACDPRNGFECVSVRVGAAVAGPYSTAPPVPSDDTEPCDDGFTVGQVSLSFGFSSVSLVNGHPQSGFIGRCRRKQLEQAFDFEGELLLTGDWNLDPFRDTDESADLWVENVGLANEGKRFNYHSGPAEKNPPLPTTRNALFTGTLDHVASSTLSGTCKTLGEAPETNRLDGADGGNGCDHRALFCDLEIAGVQRVNE